MNHKGTKEELRSDSGPILLTVSPLWLYAFMVRHRRSGLNHWQEANAMDAQIATCHASEIIFSCGILEDKFAYRLKEVAYNIYKYGQTNNYSLAGGGA